MYSRKLSRFMLRALVLITGIIIFTQVSAFSQQAGSRDTILHEAIVYNGDTIELKTLQNYYTYSRMNSEQRAASRAYNRLRNAVYVTYPYARRAGLIMNDINAKLVGITDKPERKKYINSREKDLKREFTKPLTDLSIYQGKFKATIRTFKGGCCY